MAAGANLRAGGKIFRILHAELWLESCRPQLLPTVHGMGCQVIFRRTVANLTTDAVGQQRRHFIKSSSGARAGYG
jgi:hypothetical protein